VTAMHFAFSIRKFAAHFTLMFSPLQKILARLFFAVKGCGGEYFIKPYVTVYFNRDK
jgi:hypothetical protein